ncbi:MAG: hypothetical protein WCA17_14415 [Burkholderiales bacterium]
MNQSHKQSLHKTLAFAATLAALGVSVGVPVERALAAQLPDAREDSTPRTRPVELAFTLVERQGQRQGMGDGSKQGMGDGSKQGMGDGSVRQGAHPGGVNAIRKGSSIGAKQGKYRTGATQLKIATPGGAGGQLPAVQK